MRLLILILFLLMALQACSFSGSPPPEEHFYRLPDLQAEKTEQLFDTIYLKTVMAEGLYNERAILYVKDDSPLEVRRYHYHHWLSAPAKLIQQQFKTYLEVTGMGRQIVDQRMQTQNLEISMHIRNFERLTGQSNRVRVTLDADIYLADPLMPAVSKTYQLESSAGSSMHDTAEAFGQVLTGIFNQISVDLSALKKH
ncbi:MAG: ABC-type transport auxiliary lipoprotein family protein [Gammaproteobacteria bacterium]|nr:ABC-type transport auxiliary lipoprotein family protein [Gammaproteobacteria bacterium]MCW8911004.1 ABC-type transport auxiliary lipoprotein family protein [Gammaproteobacteria bacterium]MCW9006191.1 ABC-type transport auxiliary lipoprotein family protein [Gammaproteobacteria bacterium]